MAKAFAGISKLNAATTDQQPIILKKRNTTSGSSPLTARLTDQEKQILQQWVAELQKQTNKNLTAAKILRGLLHMKDQIKPDKLIKSIEQNT